eukprot:CAMPEP_0119380760 /NCGR_PEP_ID=MMETSP1334-20130426/57909_1 /TAXON_ID=127549 /ORGANISM="Calcidiscus leptoporus, Strain RCC1130" /LENGTH=56 /DNA_ID=CAMNT_0007400691 /DNA_START=214 /DNA_END=384 /DNA_ORIENTATION=+
MSWPSMAMDAANKDVHDRRKTALTRPSRVDKARPCQRVRACHRDTEHDGMTGASRC